MEEIKKKRFTKELYCKILDEANAVLLYVEDGWTYKQISDKFGISTSSVSTYLRTIKKIKVREPKKRPELRNVYPIGTKFGLWTIISDEVKVGSNRALYLLCLCCCGNTQWKSLIALRMGTTTKCKKCTNKTFLTKTGEININGMIVSFFNHIVSGLKSRKKHKVLNLILLQNILKNYMKNKITSVL